MLFRSLWENFLGKPPGKASRESHRSLDPQEGKRDTAVTAREESTRAGPNSRRGLTRLGRLRSTPSSMSALERNPQVPAPTPHKVLGPSIEGRGIPRGPRATRMVWSFLRPPERFPEVRVVGREHLPQLEKIQEVLPAGEMRPISTEASRG